MLKRMPERALKSRESFQVSFSAAGKIRIAEKALRFRRLAGFPETFCKQVDFIQCMQSKAHSEHGER
ncbi:hypothetical protein [Slackia isoflavoniconvertens]|uniref:hypothetical protein n=1 Tax=Slackia isoflavoniconvertens TaxID=572010 RepID=UPI003AF04B3B